MRYLLAILLLLTSGFGCDGQSSSPSTSPNPTYTAEEVKASRALIQQQAKLGKQRFDALDAARPSAPYLSDFMRLFPTAALRHRYFDASRMPGFDAEVELHGRYILNMQLPAIFDAAGTKVMGFGEPTFTLLEIATRNGRQTTYDSSGRRRFGAAEWKVIVMSNGDFSAIGYPMRTDAPIKNLGTP